MLARLGTILLWLGFLGGSLVSIRKQDAIAWSEYAVAAVLMALGVVALQLGRRRGLRQDDRIARELEEVTQSLDSILTVLAELKEQQAALRLDEIPAAIDARLVPRIGVFVDARASIITAFGVGEYGRIMSEFALGERLLNRTWCAAADSYIDETWSSLSRSSAAFERARSVLDEQMRGFDDANVDLAAGAPSRSR